MPAGVSKCAPSATCACCQDAPSACSHSKLVCHARLPVSLAPAADDVALGRSQAHRAPLCAALPPSACHLLHAVVSVLPVNISRPGGGAQALPRRKPWTTSGKATCSGRCWVTLATTPKASKTWRCVSGAPHPQRRAGTVWLGGKRQGGSPTRLESLSRRHPRSWSLQKWLETTAHLPLHVGLGEPVRGRHTRGGGGQPAGRGPRQQQTPQRAWQPPGCVSVAAQRARQVGHTYGRCFSHTWGAAYSGAATCAAVPSATYSLFPPPTASISSPAAWFSLRCPACPAFLFVLHSWRGAALSPAAWPGW